MNRIDRVIYKMKIPWDSPVNVLDVYNGILEHCRAVQHGPERIAWSIRDGVLYADEKPLKRVGPKDRRSDYDARADYWENKILERQEQYMD